MKKIIIAALAIALILILLYGRIIFQEGNPLPIFYGIIKLTFSKDKIAPLPGLENKYISKSDTGTEGVSYLLASEGYIFLEQLGSGYVFVNEEEDKIIAVRRNYSRFYQLWYIPK